MPSAHHGAPRIFTPEYYARLQEIEAKHWWYRGMRALTGRWLNAELGGRTNLSVLDVGCGAGFMLRWLQRYAGLRSVVGIDYDESAIQYARQQGCGSVVRASAIELPFPAGRFDLVHCADVLQHLPTAGGDAAALAECYRVLMPRGLLIVRTNATPGLGEAGDDPNYQRYRLSVLTARVRAAGFIVLRATHVNVLPSLTATVRRARRGPVAHAVAEHGPGLPTLPRVAILNRLLSGVLGLEAVALSWPGVIAPFGHSALVMARRE